MTFGLLLKHFVIGLNWFVLRDRAFIFGTIKFERVTFDLLLNFSHNFLTVRDWAFVFGICVPYVHTFPMVA